MGTRLGFGRVTATTPAQPSLAASATRVRPLRRTEAADRNKSSHMPARPLHLCMLPAFQGHAVAF